MPTPVTHIVAGIALGQASDSSWTKTWRFWGLAALCSVLPDVDVLGHHYFGIPYGSFWGHRGFLHSLTFAVIAGTLLSLLVRCPLRERWKPALMLVVIMASHGVLGTYFLGSRSVSRL
jgi:inner membrane protein